MEERWVQVTPSDFPWEREALAFLKQALPDHEPYRAWSNFEFIDNGSINEVDVLIVSPHGLFLVEIKSWPGTVEGDAGTWTNRRPDGTVRSFDNPLLGANRKAKRLKSLLDRQRVSRGHRLPFLRPLVFLSAPDLDVRLEPDGREGVVTRADVVETLTRPSQRQRETGRPREVDRPAGQLVARALEQAGVRPSQALRRVGDFHLDELLAEGPGWQDWAAHHGTMERTRRRVRIYGASASASEEDRARASRAARREFELLERVDHRGILRALDFREHELGPALLFDHHPEALRLDHFLQRHGDQLTVHDRLGLVRDLAEALGHAHGKRLYHRALSPQSVLVVEPGAPGQRAVVLNWQTGAAQASDGTTAGTVAGTSHVEQLVEQAAAVYLAPEHLTNPGAAGEQLDVFSLGAIAYHVVTGQPPARTLAELVGRLREGGGLQVSAVLDGAPRSVSDLVEQATAADVTRRLSSVEDVLAGLDLIEEELTAPDPLEEEQVDPATARPGDLLAGMPIHRRLGRGSTAIAFLVERDGRERVLKVAADADRNDRVRDEGEVLAKLRDRTVVELIDGEMDVHGHAALLLAYADRGTLAARLREEGRLPLELLERFGEDLLSAVAYLEEQGIAHRDIKPDNLGVVTTPKDRRQHLVLFDFSLSRTPTDRTGAGTPQYLDPFAVQRGQLDLAAERYAAAVTLHEMATNTLPVWGDGQSNPATLDCEVTIDREGLPREVADELAPLLERALRREATERFDTAEDMLKAWRRAFDRAGRPTEETADPARRDELLDAAAWETSVEALGLSSRATNTLERLGALTIADLLALPPTRINAQRGVGKPTVKELLDAVRHLRGRLGTPTATATTTGEEPDVQALDPLARQLIPRETARTAGDVGTLRALIGLEGDHGAWPDQAQVAEAAGVDRRHVNEVLVRARERWRGLPAVTRLREDLLAFVRLKGGVTTAQELGLQALAQRGAAAEGEQRTRLAYAAVRAALEAEAGRAEPRLRVRRGARVLVALDGVDDAEAEPALDYAEQLGREADRLADMDPLASPAGVLETLRAVAVPTGLGTLPQPRLVELAAAASEGAAVSGRLELYPVDMAPERALRLAQGALVGVRELTEEELRRRVAGRFPASQELPARPALDRLLERVGLPLRWSGSAYTEPTTGPETPYGESSLIRQPTATRSDAGALDGPAREAKDFERRLERARDGGGLLVLMARPAEVEAAGLELERLGVTAMSLDVELLRQMHAVADDLGVEWSSVLAADAAGPRGQDWPKLMALVDRAERHMEDSIVDTDGVALLRHPGLLARYGRMALVDRLRERLRRDDLHGAWLLVPAGDAQAKPTVDGQPVPLFDTSEWARVPRAWVENAHRGRRREEAVA